MGLKRMEFEKKYFHNSEVRAKGGYIIAIIDCPELDVLFL